MGKIVEIQRSNSECCACVDMADSYDQVPDCTKCKKKTGEWIDTVSNFWGTYAVVCMEDGGVEKISLNRLKVIKEA